MTTRTRLRALYRLTAWVSVTIAATAIVSCRGDLARTSADAADRRLIEQWLTCEECMQGELDSVKARGAPLEKGLAEAIDGPPEATVAALARSSGEQYVRMRAQFERTSPAERALRPLGDSLALVQWTVDNFRRTYRTRAIRALHAINPPEAKALFRRRLLADSVGAIRRLDPIERALMDSLASLPP